MLFLAKKISFALALFSFVIVNTFSTAMAKEEESIPSGLYPAITTSLKYDDNILRIDDVKTDDSILSILPSLTLNALWGKHTLEASYFAEIVRFKENKDENFNDHYANADLLLDLTRKLNVRFEADYATAHELRGSSGTRIQVSRTPDKWWADRILGEVSYGRRTFKNQIVFTAEGYRRRYVNNEQEPRSRNRAIFVLDFYRNLGPRTRLLIEGGYSSYDYYDKNAPIDLTSAEYKALVGFTWEATAKTTGMFKVGYLKKDLEDGTLPDFEGWSLESEVIWEPKAYSEVTLNIARKTKESPHTIGSYYDSMEIGVQWEHELSERLVLVSKLHFQNDNYSEITTSFNREEDLTDFEAELQYDVLTWLDAGVRYNYSRRNSTYPGIDYSANIIMFQIAADTMKRAR